MEKRFQVIPTSQKGTSLLVSEWKRGETNLPAISIELPTDIAREIRKRWDFYDEVIKSTGFLDGE